MTLSEAYKRVREAERARESLHTLRGHDPQVEPADESWRESTDMDDLLREDRRRAA